MPKILLLMIYFKHEKGGYSYIKCWKNRAIDVLAEMKNGGYLGRTSVLHHI